MYAIEHQRELQLLDFLLYSYQVLRDFFLHSLIRFLL
jgi:hypothetical protein